MSTMNPNPQNQKSTQALRPDFAKGSVAAREEAILEYWKEKNIFEKTMTKDALQGDFVFFDGPPTANGMPGLHHVEPQSFKDIIPRYKTMQGFHVPRRAGWDTHGLPVELQVEKELGLKSKKEIEQYGVAAFNQKCKESVWKYKGEWMKMRKRMGFWTDMDHAYITYENNYIEALWGVVKEANERGHLYRDFKVLPWCTRCGTALSSHELNQPGAYKDVKDVSVYVKFKLTPGQKIGDYEIGDNTYMLAWTTTPWTLPGNVALAVNEKEIYGLFEVTGISSKSTLNIGDKVIVCNNKDLVLKSLFGGTASFNFNENGLTRVSGPILKDDIESNIELALINNIKGLNLVSLSYEPLFPYLSDLITPDQKEKLPNAFKVYPADFVTTTDGTGIVHTAVMYGVDDFDLGTKYNLPKFHTVNEEGKFIAGAGFLEGRYVKEVDENGKPTLAIDIIDDLTKRELLFKKENYLHSYPHCWRCDTPLLYYARTSWYFRMSALREQLLAGNEQINWEPDHIKEGRFGEWLDSIKDWAISRDRYWGTPLPIWQTADASKKVVIGSLADIKKYSKKSGNKYFVMRHGQAESNLTHVWSSAIDAPNPLTEEGVVQVKASAETLRGKHIDLIIASPVLRTKMTAEIVAETIGLAKEDIVFDMRLREINPGDEYQGKPLASFLEQFPSYKDRFTTPNPKGESYADVKRRIMEAFFDADKTYAGKTILFVTHGGPIMGFIIGSEGMLNTGIPDDLEFKYYPKNAEWKELSFTSFPHNEEYELDFHKPFIDEITLELDGESLKRTPEVMDVWFDSGAMPYAQGHVLGEAMDFSPAAANYISEAIDQTRGWFYTLHAVANMLSDSPKAAYKNVVCLGHILDANGQKMSKSKGNVVDPWDMFDKYGADAVRLWMYSVNQPGESKNFDEKTLAELSNKFFRVIENCVQMLEMYGSNDRADFETLAQNDTWQPGVMEDWCTALLVETDKKVTESLDRYDLFTAARTLRDFVTELSQWYVRRSRESLRESYGARAFLRSQLRELARLSAPFTPFTAEWLWQTLGYGGDNSVHESVWGNLKDSYTPEHKALLEEMHTVRELISLALSERQKAGIKVKQPLALVMLKVENENALQKYTEIIKDELNVKEVVFGDETIQGSVMLDTEITPELKREGGYRELVRAVQDLRKQQGLMPSDVVTITLSQNTEEILSLFLEEFKKTVGANNVSFDGVDGDEVKIDDYVFKVSIEKN